MPEARSGGVIIHYEVCGRGRPVLLHTGGGGDGEMWRLAGYVEQLADFQTVLLDHRGHGRSGHPRDIEAHRIERYVEDVIAVLDHLGLEKTAFIGYSDGAAVGFALAAAHPERVTCLVALGGVGSPPGLTSEEDLNELRRLGIQGLIAQMQADEEVPVPGWLADNLMSTDPEMFLLEIEGWMTWEGPWALRDRLRVPTLLIVGEEEDPRYSYEFAASLVNGRAATLPGLGHLGSFTASTSVLAEARPFLELHLPR